MSDAQIDTSNWYLATLLRYYEEEISGEAYFYALADHFPERDKIILLARIERRAAQAIEPLLKKYGLQPREESVLKNLERSYLKLHQTFSWTEFMSYMVDRYPDYLDEFHALEKMAPFEDLAALNLLTEHEVAVIDFAEKELAGDSDSLLPLLQYLE
jgi:dimethylamine/trimethylamine dehydrogenase